MLEAHILNRVVRKTVDGWEYEADQRHAQILIQEMQVEKPAKTPGEEEVKWKMEEGEQKLEGARAAQYRALAARANYLATDRTDLQYAVKEVCRGVANPEVRHQWKLKRLARYLAGRPRAVWKYLWQPPCDLTAYSDSDYAGCRRTARSTSGGIILR